MSEPTYKCVSCTRELCADKDGNAKDAVLKNKGRMSDKGGAAVWVCVKCNRLSARVYKITAASMELSTSCGALTREERQDFFLENAALMGKDLVKAITNTVSLSYTDEQIDGFLANGKWLDEEDLDEKYKNKPAQLAEIKKRARTFVHPTRQVKLYEDLDFDSTAGVTAKRKAEQRVESQSKEQEKKPKRQKTEEEKEKDKEAKPEKVDKNKGKPLSASQQEKYTKLAKKLNDTIKTLEDTTTTVSKEQYADYVAKAAHGKGNSAVLEAKAQQAALALMLEPGWAGKAPEVEREIREKMNQAQTASTWLLKQIADVDELRGTAEA